MGGFIARQPNGLLCRFSTIVDTVTHINMTEDDYIEYLETRWGLTKEEAAMEKEEIIANHVEPFSEVIQRFIPLNNTKEEFIEKLRKMGDKDTSIEDLNDF